MCNPLALAFLHTITPCPGPRNGEVGRALMATSYLTDYIFLYPFPLTVSLYSSGWLTTQDPPEFWDHWQGSRLTFFVSFLLIKCIAQPSIVVHLG